LLRHSANSTGHLPHYQPNTYERFSLACNGTGWAPPHAHTSLHSANSHCPFYLGGEKLT
jgi:hypothetical protein